MLIHYCDVIIGKIASQITSITIVYSAVYSGTDQRKHQSSASLAFVRGIHRRPVNSPHKWPVTRKMFPFDDVITFIASGLLGTTFSEIVIPIQPSICMKIDFKMLSEKCLTFFQALLHWIQANCLLTKLCDTAVPSFSVTWIINDVAELKCHLAYSYSAMVSTFGDH